MQDLAPGDYTITVKNTDGCTSAETATINPVPNAPEVPVLAATQPDCINPLGSIEVTSPLGAEYTYSIDGTTFQAETTFAGLAPGDYTITVKNTDGCTSAETATINPVPNAPEVPVLAATQPDCINPLGSIEVTSPLGAEYTYSIDGTTFQAETTFAGLAPGDYTITVKNTDGCTSAETATINPVPNAPEVPVLAATQPDCINPLGSIEVTSPLGAEYSYSIDGTTFQTETTFAGLAPGDYTITVKNTDGCTSAETATINPVPNAPEVPVLAATQPDCINPLGSIEVTSPLGAEYTYSIDGTTFQAETTFAGLTPGDYTITVKNTDGCTSAETATINPVPNAPEVPVLAATQPDCINPLGSIEVTSPLGAEYSYSIDGTTFQAETTFAGLAPGDYTITVKNTDGCTSAETATINPVPNAPEVPVLAATQPDCINPLGSIEVTSPLGAEYTYSIDGTTFQTETTFAGLAPGDYTITVKNTDGCTSAETATINPVPNAPEVPVLAATQPDCINPLGSIEVTSPLGAEYTYSIDGTTFQAETTFAGLAPGDYTITVKNTDGCTSAETATINPVPNAPEVPVLAATQPDCINPLGSIEVTSPLGAEYSYSIDGTTFQTETTFAGLAPGDYTITVKNTDGCTSAETATINPVPNAPEVPVLAATQPDCINPLGSIEVTSPLGAEYTYSIDGTTFQAETTFAGLAPGDYTITVKNTDGCTSAETATINPVPNAPEVPVLAATQPDCINPLGSIEVTSPLGAEYSYSIDGTTFQTETTFAGLAPGDYTITVKNTDGCTSAETATINPVPNAPEVPVLAATQPDCINPLGSIEVTSPLGAEYTYSIDGTTFQTETTFAGLTPGDYTITVKNTDGCTSAETATINPVPNAPEVPVLAATQPDCINPLGSIEVTSPLGAEYTYSIDGTTFQTETTFAGLAPGDYTITVKNTDGCTSAETATINPVPNAPEVPVLAATQPDCINPLGSIEVTSPLGAEYTYSIDGTTFQTETTFAGPCSG